MLSILNGGRTMVKTSQNQPVKKKRNTRGMGSIRQKNGGYEGRITIKVNGKSKQISLFNKDKRILVQEMIKAKQEANDNEYVEKDKITLEEWLNNMMYAYMQYIMEQRGYTKKEQLDDEYIFMNSLGHALSSDYLWDTLDKILKRHNFKHLSVYQLRHLFATRCIDVNIPVNQIKQYLGHALASTTMDYYVEYDEDTNKAEIEKLEQVNNIQVVPEFLKGMEQIMSIPKDIV